MKKRPVIRTVVLVPLLCGAFAAGVFASDGVKKVTAYLRPEFKVVLDGIEVQMKNPPLIYADRSYLPVRELGDLLGADIDWNNAQAAITIKSAAASGATGYTGGAINTGTPSGAETPNSGGASGTGAGTAAGTDTGSGKMTPGVDSSTIKVPAEIALTSAVTYDLKYLNQHYVVLTNEYLSSLYIRLSDLAAMGIDTTKLKVSTEKYTKERYASAEQLFYLWKEPPVFTIADEPAMTGITDAGKRKALQSYVPESGSVVLSITPGSSNQFTYLLQDDTMHYYGYKVTLNQYGGSWQIGEATRIEFGES